MLKRTIAAVLLLSALPTLAAFEDSSAPAEIKVGVVVRSTDFFAHNFSAVPQIMFFRAGSFCTWRVLQPGADFSSSYARAALDGVKLEIASFDEGTWRTSGNFDLSDVCDSGADALWVQDGPQPPSWLEVGHALSHVTPESSQLPAWMLAAGPGPVTEAFEPTHVPVITPVDRPDGDKPPVLDDKPLPPG